MTTFIKVKVYQRSVGRNCMHCNRNATVKALRISQKGGPKMPVYYCAEHAEVRGCFNGS